MSENLFATLVKDGAAYIKIIESVPEDKRFLLSMVADAFINGMETQERLTNQAARPSA